MGRGALSSSVNRNEKLPPRARAAWVPRLLIVLAILATFWRVSTAEFVMGDDQPNLTQNPFLNPPTWSGLAHLWSHPYAHEYIPLTYTVWWLLVRVAGLDVPDAHGVWLNPYVFHSANLLLHIGACLAVYGLLRRLTGRMWPACGGALLFALHPLQVEPVAWATGLKDLLSGCLSIVALWQYVQIAETENTGSVASQSRQRRWVHYAIATAALIAAMLAKPSATSVPVLAIIIERLMLRRPWRSVALAAGPWLLITASFIAIGVLVQPTLGAVNVPVWARPLVAGDSLAFYLQKLCVPVRLAPRYPHSANAVVTSWQLKVAWLAPASLLAFCWGLRRGAPWLLAGTLIFFAAPLPVLGLVPFHYQRLSTVADRYVYVAMLGPSLVLAFALAAICQSKGCRPALRWAAGACTAALAVALASRSARQSRSWQNTELLCRRILALDPSNAPAYAALARDARENGRLAEAEGYARRAATLEPDSLDDELYLGQTLQAQDRQSDAAAVYRDAIRRHPNSANAWVSLADALANGGHPGPAIAMCRAAISLDSNNAVAHRDLAMLLVGQHENSQAVAEAAEAVRLEPSAAINHMIYGKTLAIAGRQAEADQQFAAAKALAPQGHGNRFGSN